MIEKLRFGFTFAAALGSGLMAGVFFAFSTFVMKALSRLSPGTGIAAMNSINIVVINPLFLGVFIGTAGLCLAAIVTSLMRWEMPGSAYVLAGGACYVVGTFLVTMFFNVPLNNSLATVTAADPDAAQRWANYLDAWTMWNHVRTLAALVALGFFILSLRH